MPAEPFNSLVRKGTAGKTIQKCLEAVKPETVYFTEQDGHRGAIMIVDVKDPSAIPGLAEPFLSQFQRDMQIPDRDDARGIGEVGDR